MNLNLIASPLAVMLGGFEPWIIGLLVPIAALIFVGVVIVTRQYLAHRERELWHQTARLAIEKGQPVPAMPAPKGWDRKEPPAGVDAAEWQEARRRMKQREDLKAALILIAIGLALYYTSFGPGSSAGVIVGAIGVALLVWVIIDKMSSRRSASPDYRNRSS